MRQAGSTKASPRRTGANMAPVPARVPLGRSASASTTARRSRAGRSLWFPTGGGKTEAYLGLAAIEIFRRRLVYGISGGGTAVLTRYTLRLLTAQQFQRAASLICAMELLRRPDRFGDSAGRRDGPVHHRPLGRQRCDSRHRAEAGRPSNASTRPRDLEEANQFQVESCPWCGTALLPASEVDRPRQVRLPLVGRDVVIHCTDTDCRFKDELPVAVVDEVALRGPARPSCSRRSTSSPDCSSIRRRAGCSASTRHTGSRP